MHLLNKPNKINMSNLIETERLLLRPVTENDAEALFEYCRNVNIGSNAGWKPHESIEETREIIKLVFLDKEHVFGIVLKETGQLFGSIGLIPDPKRQNDKTRMTGYAIAENYWNKGYATEALQAVLRFGFEKLELQLISAYCYPFNEQSKKVLKKCGFQYEGKLHLAEKRYDGIILDNDCYYITEIQT
jgi:putative acetyltransferase